ncbi:hypothetical protein CR203_05670 [Salipaludibacillus neizhouensis]|uniref:Putative manganese efflux pump MntP n=1 Tax=Salipaludibacillus neizhouensis TaxID=885475 RepID=A0A3A9K4M1_9BACI|nr:manganese efflux pump MntP family protein [Salipaludibacillus neizhouensis]RKL67994.1 hypothetical protein CR203_05670 [Salipaludibacillus neizhouensis]
MVAEFITIGIMALALSLDAFSLSLGLGMAGLRYRRIFIIGSLIGLFHMLMPLGGIIIGQALSHYLGPLTYFIGGSGLIFLGIQMLASSFKYGADSLLAPKGIGLFIFAISVSVDSFSAGLSLGMVGAKTWLTVISFGVISAILTWIGLLVGKKAGGWVGKNSEGVGGIILILFGVKMIMGAV